MTKKISPEEFFRLRRLVYRNARPLDYAMWKYLFENGSGDDFLRVLSGYQNEDGGFGHNIECNNWNPNSSPYTVCIALDYLDIVEEPAGGAGGSIIAGIMKYLESGVYMLESGWVGMQGIPGNNDYAHMPWFHFDPGKATEADIGVTKRLSDFILRYGEHGSDIYKKAAGLRDRYKDCSQVLLEGYPDYDPEALDIKSYDPDNWASWLPLPVYFVGSPESSYYPECRRTVELNLDTIVDRLVDTGEFQFASPEDLEAYEKSTPHPEGKRWCLPEQTVGNYYWGAHFITRDMNILRRFDRLDFSLPVLN